MQSNNPGKTQYNLPATNFGTMRLEIRIYLEQFFDLRNMYKIRFWSRHIRKRTESKMTREILEIKEKRHTGNPDRGRSKETQTYLLYSLLSAVHPHVFCCSVCIVKVKNFFFTVYIFKFLNDNK